MLSRGRLPGVLFAVLLAVLLVPVVAGAQTITVSTMQDLGLGQSQCPADPPVQCSLRQALAQNEAHGGDTIVLPAGQYSLSAPLSPITREVTIVGQARSDTTIAIVDGQTGIFAFTPAEGQTPVTLSHLRVTGVNMLGPAIVSNSAEPLTLEDVDVAPSAAPSLVVNNGVVAIRNSRFLGEPLRNTGGIIIQAGDVDIADSEFSNDESAEGAGGGAVRLESGTLSIERSRLTRNLDGNGNGAHVQVVGGKATIVDSTLDDAGDSGSVLDVRPGAALVAENDTFLDNPGPLGSGDGSLLLENSVVSNAGEACNSDDTTTISSLGHNVIDDATCGFAGPGDRQSVDARLGPLQDNGGPTFTALPGLGSPLLAAGDPTACSPKDQRAVARPVGKSCDIGAAQRSGPPSAGSPSVSALTSTSATLSGMADLAFLDGTVSFATSAGPATPAQALLATGSTQPVSATLTGLAPSTTYLARLVVHTPLGDASSPQVVFTTRPPKPTISSASLSHRRFRVSRRVTAVAASARKRLPLGTSFRFRLSVAATVQIAFTHTATGLRDGRGRCVAPTLKLKRAKAHRCTRTLRDGTLTRAHLRAGKVTVPFSGRIGRRALASRTYVATITATNAAGGARPVRLRFVIAR